MPRRVVPGDQEENWDAIDAANNSKLPNGAIANGSGASTTAPSNGQQREWQLVQGMASSQVSSAIQRNGNQNSVDQLGASRVSGPSLPPVATKTMGMGGADLSGQYTAGQNTAGNDSQQPQLQTGSRSTDVASLGNQKDQAGSNNDNPIGAEVASGIDPNTQQSGSSSTAKTGSASNQAPPPGTNVFSSGAANGAGGASSISASGTSTQTPTDPSASPNVSVSNAKHVRPEGDLKPISVSAGHGWAASRAEGKATPVSRSIVMIALKDRWLLRSDENPSMFELNVSMEAGPQQAGNELATAIRKRVDSWGLSVPGGFWSPTLTIEAANDAQQSVARLEKLLEGSGVEIKVVSLTVPNRR